MKQKKVYYKAKNKKHNPGIIKIVVCVSHLLIRQFMICFIRIKNVVFIYFINSRNAAKPGHVYMDAMGFGMGLSCLQITFQACCLQEAETLYDQLAPLCPIMLALTAATPFARGYLTEVDCRYTDFL